jgi:hypothetical protein
MARRIGFAALGAVLIGSGTYLFVYLYRWEWNRAAIAGIFLIAAEIALASALILRKLGSIEKRLEGRADDAPSFGTGEVLDELRETAPPAKQSFRWLARSGDDLNVFVPVLMGAGIVLSGIAWLVERFARATARPALEAGLAARLAPLALPDGGFLAPVGARAPERARSRDLGRVFRLAFATLVVTAVVALAVDQLGDLTQNRPELDVTGRSGQLTLEITDHGWPHSTTDAARALWQACLGTLPNGFEGSGFVASGSNHVTVLIVPKPGESARRRLFGCLNDSTIDNVGGRVVDFGPASL